MAHKQTELELLGKETKFAQFNLAEVEKEIANYEKRNSEINRSESEVTKTRQQIDLLRKEVEIAQTNKLKNEGEVEKLKGNISICKENVKEFDEEKVEKYLQVSLAKLQQSLTVGEQKAENAEQNYETAQSKLQTVSNDLNAKRGQLSTEQSNLISLQEKEVLNQQEIENQLSESEFSDIEVVKSLLNRKLDRNAINQEIQTFQQELNLAESKQMELKAKMGEQVFSKATIGRTSRPTYEIQTRIGIGKRFAFGEKKGNCRKPRETDSENSLGNRTQKLGTPQRKLGRIPQIVYRKGLCGIRQLGVFAEFGAFCQ